MSRRIVLLMVPALVAAVGFAVGAASRADPKAGPRLAHMVFFTLKDGTKAAREALVASAQKHLGTIGGVAHFSVGTIAEGVVEPVSVRDFDVALHVIFEGKEARDAYLKDPRHDAFVAEGKDSWSKVRVFDSFLHEKP